MMEIGLLCVGCFLFGYAMAQRQGIRRTERALDEAYRWKELYERVVGRKY